MAVPKVIHEFFLKVGAGAGDYLHFNPTDHFGQRNTQFGCNHCPGKGNHHFPADIHVCFIAFRRIQQRTKCNEIYSVWQVQKR